VNPPGCEFHDEEQVECDQPALCLNLDRGEIDGGQNIPMDFEKSLPSRLSLSLRHGLDAMDLQDIADGRVGDLVVLIGERTLDAFSRAMRSTGSAEFLNPTPFRTGT
jgi:hypothetical protein